MYGVHTCFSEPIYEQTNKVISTEDIIIINFLLKKYDLVSKGLELRHHLNNIVIDGIINERDAIINSDESYRRFNTERYKKYGILDILASMYFFVLSVFYFQQFFLGYQQLVMQRIVLVL